MKKITALMLIITVLFTTVGCSKNEDNINRDLGPVMKNYVRNYIKPVKLFLPDQYFSDYKKEEGNLFFMVRFAPSRQSPYNNGEIWTWEMEDVFEYKNFIHEIGFYEHNDDNFPPIKEHLRRYDSLCVTHKDTEYSKKEKHYSGQQFFIATYRRMTLDVTSDTPYDSAHPAGKSLADIVDINVYSAKEIIESGYDISLCEKMKNDKGYEFPVISIGYKLEMPLEQFNREYRKLVADNIRLNFKVSPDVTSTHRFTVSYRDEDGRVLTATAAPVTLHGKGAE